MIEELKLRIGGIWVPRGSIVVPFWGSYLESYKVRGSIVVPFWGSYLESYKVRGSIVVPFWDYLIGF